MSLKHYIALTSIQYIFLFGTSGLFLLIGISLTMNMPYVFVLAFALLVILGLLFFVFYKLNLSFISPFLRRIKIMTDLIQSKPLAYLVLVIIIQLCGSLLAYGVELYAIGANLTTGGLLIYTGISQFSIVVALTPGAIGIREALLLVAQAQMHLSTQDIVVASTIDRVVYFVTLAIATPLALSAKSKILPKG